jgi:hypothetical protein
MNLGRFDTAIANPPFGRVRRNGKNGPRYTGELFEFHVIDIAADLAEHGTFIVPQRSAPFRLSGDPDPGYAEVRSTEYERFEQQTGIHLKPSVGINTAWYAKGWHGLIPPSIEVVRCNFSERITRPAPNMPGLPRSSKPSSKAGTQLGLFS